MKISTQIAWGSGWTIVTYGVSQLLRFATNVVLTRLLAPELFGIMVIVNSVRTGVQLTTDVGISQNIIVNRNAENPDFYDTAWTINLLRSVVLWVICLLVASPLAHFYHIEVLTIIFPIVGLLFIFEGLSSVARPLVQKRLRFAKLNIFELILDSIGFAILVILACISPTIWALVLGTLFGSAARMIGSYILLPSLRHRFYISKQFAWQIAGFSKWIFISSIALFFSMNFDRLYLGKMIPLELLGVYGIARTLSEPLTMVAQRLSGIIAFPLIASSADMPRERLHEQLSSIRLIFLLTIAFGLSIFTVTADLLISLLYDQRYQAARWMAPILIAGSWFSILCNLNESSLMGLGKPSYGAVANGVKMAWLLIGLPLAFTAYGPLGAVIAVAASDLFRYPSIFIGQIRTRFSFGIQDFAATIIVFGLIGLFEWLRWTLGFNISLGYLPIAE